MTTEEKLQHFYKVSIESAKEEAAKAREEAHEEGYRQGENVDELVELYAEECIGNGEYIRAMAAYDYLSAEAEPEEEQLRRLVELTLQSGEERRAARFLDDLVQKGGPGGETAARLQQEFNEELG